MCCAVGHGRNSESVASSERSLGSKAARLTTIIFGRNLQLRINFPVSAILDVFDPYVRFLKIIFRAIKSKCLYCYYDSLVI